MAFKRVLRLFIEDFLASLWKTVSFDKKRVYGRLNASWSHPCFGLSVCSPFAEDDFETCASARAWFDQVLQQGIYRDAIAKVSMPMCLPGL